MNWVLDNFSDKECLPDFIIDWDLNYLSEDINKDLIFKLIKKNAEMILYETFTLC